MREKSFLLLGVLLLLGLILVPFALAGDIATQRGEMVVFTTACIINGQLAADSATLRLVDIADNSTLLAATNMTMVTPGIFVLNYTFARNGNYLSLQDCFFPGNVTAQGSDDVSVTEPWTSFLLPFVGVVLLFFGTRRKTLMFFAGVCFLLAIIIAQPGVLFSLILFLVGIGCFFDAARQHMKQKG